MTTMAALLGTLPIALGHGAGAESRRPLGLAVVGGLLFSQLVTLYATPVFYIYLDKLQARFDRRRARIEAEDIATNRMLEPVGAHAHGNGNGHGNGRIH
jgi:HAE1 family hydrophobic/amphiphilic exporter-1